jgi:hypothetical protein
VDTRKWYERDGVVGAIIGIVLYFVLLGLIVVWWREFTVADWLVFWFAGNAVNLQSNINRIRRSGLPGVLL